MEIKLKIGAISRDNSEYCHYAIPENRAEDREKPRKISRIRAWGDRAEISPTPNIGYHGLLVAALPTPLGRMMMLDRLNEQRLGLPDGSFAPIGVEALVSRPIPDVSGRLTKFHLEAGLPVWRYKVGGVTLEKRLLLPHLQNTVYRML